jgi:hypothetical protein
MLGKYCYSPFYQKRILFFMSDVHFHRIKHGVLGHIQQTFEELEEAMAMQHQEKYALLEDSFENANDVDELRISFEQWHRDHADDLRIEEGASDLWDTALSLMDEEDELDEIETDDDEDDEEDE